MQLLLGFFQAAYLAQNNQFSNQKLNFFYPGIHFMSHLFFLTQLHEILTIRKVRYIHQVEQLKCWKMIIFW